MAIQQLTALFLTDSAIYNAPFYCYVMFVSVDIKDAVLFLRLFVLPHYCSAFVDLALLHSRRKRNRSEKDYRKELEVPKTDTKVYICATMWHENRIEMKQILISIFR